MLIHNSNNHHMCFVSAIATMFRVPQRVVLFGVLVALNPLGCGNDDGELQCCMLRKLGNLCGNFGASESAVARAAKWSEIGNRENADACKAMIESGELYCSMSSGATYEESDAVAACSK